MLRYLNAVDIHRPGAIVNGSIAEALDFRDWGTARTAISKTCPCWLQIGALSRLEVSPFTAMKFSRGGLCSFRETSRFRSGHCLATWMWVAAYEVPQAGPDRQADSKRLVWNAKASLASLHLGQSSRMASQLQPVSLVAACCMMHDAPTNKAQIAWHENKYSASSRGGEAYKKRLIALVS